MVIIIIAATIAVTLTEFGSIGIAQGQGNLTSSLTPQQKAAMCDPSNPTLSFINGTESEICGIPKTPISSSAAASANTTATQEEESSSSSIASIAPSAVPPP